MGHNQIIWLPLHQQRWVQSRSQKLSSFFCRLCNDTRAAGQQPQLGRWANDPACRNLDFLEDCNFNDAILKTTFDKALINDANRLFKLRDVRLCHSIGCDARECDAREMASTCKGQVLLSPTAESKPPQGEPRAN